MNLIDILWLSVALAMDCFAVSITMGMTKKTKDSDKIKEKRSEMLVMAFSFGLFQMLMPVFALLVGQVAREWLIEYHGWVALLILSVLGVRMIWEELKGEEEESEWITKGKSTVRTVLLLSVATSIDSLTTGVLFVPLSMGRVVMALFIIGLGSFLFTLIGYQMGAIFAEKAQRIHPKLIGGVMLILIGVKIFFL